MKSQLSVEGGTFFFAEFPLCPFRFFRFQVNLIHAAGNIFRAIPYIDYYEQDYDRKCSAWDRCLVLIFENQIPKTMRVLVVMGGRFESKISVQA